jgi:predicted AlkP superfamily pyrophosphatase or phosphodiesterase
MKVKSLYIYCLVIFLFSACHQKKRVVAEVVDLPKDEIIRVQKNSEATLQKPYVILISLDGFRYDYAKRFGATNLLNFDVKADKLISSFPTKTFPNHYAIATGLYPGNNGLVSNSFYNPKREEHYRIRNRTVVRNKEYYKGTPLWVLASQQEMVSASMFWVGSEAAIKDTYPTYYFNYNGRVTNEQRVNQAVEWLKLPEEKRPHFITMYFSLADDIGHKFGPNSPEIETAVKQLDTTIGDLISKTKKLNLPINFVVVSGHGMKEVDINNVIYYKEMIPKRAIVSASFPLMVYSKDSKLIDSLYTNFKKDSTRVNVYLKSNMPKHYHYKVDDDRVGDLIVMPKSPYIFGKRSRNYFKGNSTHGYDPTETDEMGAIFYAKGPNFKKNKQISAFENIHIFPLISKLLELDYSHLKIDGSIEVLENSIEE